jgi:hypothetical protein
MSESGPSGRAWRIHGVALVLWVVLYFGLFWEVLFREPKPGFNLDGLGAALAGFGLGIYMCVTTLVVAFAWRRPVVPVVMHGLAFAALCISVFVEDGDRRVREAEQERERARQEQERVREGEREEQARRERAERDRREEEQRAKERQPEGCLHVREVRVQDEKKRLRAEVTFATTCDGAVVVDDLTLVGIDRAGGSDVVRRWDGEPVTVPRGETATAAIEDVVRRGGARSISLASWAWRLDVETTAPRFSRLCFATAGMPGGSDCAGIDAVVAR